MATMHPSDDPLPSSTRTRRDVGMALVTFFIFVIFGPLFGLLTLIMPVALLSSSGGGHLNLNLFGFLGFLSYLAGGLQAASVGLVAAIAQYRNRRLSVVPVLLASFVTGVAFLALTALKSERPVTLDTTAGLLGIHCAAGLGCWLIAQLLLWPFHAHQSVTVRG